MARPRSADFEQQRAQVLTRAAQLFATRGYTATTMQELAVTCGVSKATLYHYVQDKHALLAQIALGHVARLEDLVAQVCARGLPAQDHLRELILRFMQAYAQAQHEHRVLTEDVKFLDEAERQLVLDAQRRVVTAFASAIVALRPAVQAQQLGKPLAMLLFGMINWTFTWLRPDGLFTHESLAPLVVQLFLGGLNALPEAEAA